MRYYVRAEIERFLRAVDRALKRPATIIIIGGGAAALKYRINDPTTDIDTFNALGADLRRAIDAAREATGLAMPFEQSGVADGPYDFEDRLLRCVGPALRGGDGPGHNRSATPAGELPRPRREPVSGGRDPRRERARAARSEEQARCFPGVAGEPQETPPLTAASWPWALTSTPRIPSSFSAAGSLNVTL